MMHNQHTQNGLTMHVSLCQSTPVNVSGRSPQSFFRRILSVDYFVRCESQDPILTTINMIEISSQEVLIELHVSNIILYRIYD